VAELAKRSTKGRRLPVWIARSAVNSTAARLGDRRRFERLVRVLEDFHPKPDASAREACSHSWARLKGAYCLLNNDGLSMYEILAPHYASPPRVIRKCALTLTTSAHERIARQ
jgi:hypothetical protein